jgi:hypothetical protein
MCEPGLFQCEPSPFGEPGPGAGDDEPRAGEEVVLTQDQVGRDVVGCPRAEQRRSPWAELVQQVAELLSLDGVEEQVGHADRS